MLIARRYVRIVVNVSQILMTTPIDFTVARQGGRLHAICRCASMARLPARAFAREKGNDAAEQQHGNHVLHKVHQPEARWVPDRR